MNTATALWYHKRRYTIPKIALACTTSFGLTYAIWCVLETLGPLAGLWGLVLVPLVPMPVLFLLGLVEQRMRLHAFAAGACALCGLVASWLFTVNLSPEEIQGFVCVYVPMMWALGILASTCGVGAGRTRYKIVFGRRGACLGCGYPLRGLPTMTCPECGRQFTAEETDPNVGGQSETADTQ